jgi:hypothetical protein
LCVEDKIVQQAVATVLEAIYEEDFVGFSYGFRPGRGQHDTLDALHVGILRKRVNWVLDADIRGFFDAMSHSWILRFLEHRIADKRILRLIAKWLKVGIIEDGRVTRSQCGAPQGAVISPTLANVYLHYVYDLWVHRWRQTKATGDVIVVRFADDTIVGFEHEHEAMAFLQELHERMRSFELALHPDKTRLICFGRHAAKQRERRGEGKPQNVRFFGLYPLLHAIIQVGLIRHRAQDDQEAHASQAQGDQDGVAQTYARPRRGNRSLGEADVARASELLRGLGQPPEHVVVLQSGTEALAHDASATKPEGRSVLGALASSIASFRQSRHYTRCPATASTLKPEGGARCVSSARRDLCGGRGAILVPTATLRLTPQYSARCPIVA